MPKKQEYKIVEVDNFGNESVDDVLICESIPDITIARFIADKLNEKLSGYSASKYYRVVEQEYELYKFQP